MYITWIRLVVIGMSIGCVSYAAPRGSRQAMQVYAQQEQLYAEIRARREHAELQKQFIKLQARLCRIKGPFNLAQSNVQTKERGAQEVHKSPAKAVTSEPENKEIPFEAVLARMRCGHDTRPGPGDDMFLACLRAQKK